MGILDLFSDNPSPDKFAKMLLARLKSGGETRKVIYDKESFTLRREEDDHVFYLGNAFAEFQRASPEEVENVVRVFLSTWFTSQMELPESLDDAKADVLVTVRDRSYFELDIPLCSDKLEMAEGLVYYELAECLAVAPVYDMPTSIRSLSKEDLEAWGVTLYEVLEIAKQNLKEMTEQCAQMGELYVFASGDSHDAARILLTDIIGSLDLSGAPIAMVPNRETLLITGEDSEEGLSTMLAVAEQALVHERRISSVAFRLEGDEWSPWLPSADHPLRQQFGLLRAQASVGDYQRQKELLEKQHQRSNTDLFVATYNAIQDEEGDILSYTTWGEGVATLLPKADYVLFMSSGESGMPSTMAAAAEWDRVIDETGHLMTNEQTYPERHRVVEFPTADLLNRLGIADWAREK